MTVRKKVPKAAPKIVAGPPGPPTPKAWHRGRTAVSAALEALDVGKSIVLVGATPEERVRARASIAYLQRKLGRRYPTRIVDRKGTLEFVIWRTS